MANSHSTVISAERLATEELCPRRRFWTEKYVDFRVSPLRALYMALDAGLRSEGNEEKDAENQLLSLARSPGLDIVGEDVFAVAIHLAKLAGIISLALRSSWDTPWKPVDPIPLPRGITWHSGLYDIGEGPLRRITLVDRWTDERRMQEFWGWRTQGEVCALNKPILVTAITIGPVHYKRRHSAWSRCHQAPRGSEIRFKRRQGTEGFGNNWKPVWREDCDLSTESWLTKMRRDGCITELVHTLEVHPPPNRDAYMAEMFRMARAIEKPDEKVPPMRLAGCFGFSPCNFRLVCHDGVHGQVPEEYGFVPRKVLEAKEEVVAC